MAKKSGQPFILKFIQWGFPKLEYVFPWLAKKLAVKLFFTPFHFPEPEREKNIRAKARIRELNLDGRKLFMYSWGEGKPVIFCHGWSGRGTQCVGFIDVFNQAGYSIHAFDAPGHGRSEGSTSGIFEYKEALEAVIEKTGTPEAIIGHSFGGIVSIFSYLNGIPLKKVMTIGSPTVAPYIVEEFTNRIRGSSAIATYFYQYVEKKYGRPFKDASIIEMCKKTGPFNLLMIHDRKDQEVPIRHLEQVLAEHPWIASMQTEGNGHHKILRQQKVVLRCLKFIRDVNKNE